MNYSLEQLQQCAKQAYCKAEFARRLGITQYNGRVTKLVDAFIRDNNLDVTHFVGHANFKKITHKVVTQQCPVCFFDFTYKKYPTVASQVVCSKACANTYFRSGRKNPNAKNSVTLYRSVCFANWDKCCAIPDCNWTLVLDVHHVDRNRENSSKYNLLPLCQNHHKLTQLPKNNKHRQAIDNQIGLLILNKSWKTKEP